ncbi:aspartate aminotransferase family protein, partial [Acinetobacter baumannii]|nr:aspartate aminotransferase family protein [Acinetobacter baumannii]
SNVGLIGAGKLDPRDGDANIRGFELGMKRGKEGFYVRFGGDTLQFGPMFNSTEADIDRLMNAVGDALYQVN